MTDEKPWRDLMIDLETMGTAPDSAIVGVGACFFDIDREEIGPTFYRAVHLATSVNLGMKIDPGTVLWWLRQGAAAREAIAYNLHDVRVVLDEFRAFTNEHSLEPDRRPWGNGAGFDMPILETAYRLVGQEPPWRFGKVRCFRTIRNWYGGTLAYEPENRIDGTYHNALDDAIFQAKHIFAIKNALRAKAQKA